MVSLVVMCTCSLHHGIMASMVCIPTVLPDIMKWGVPDGVRDDATDGLSGGTHGTPHTTQHAVGLHGTASAHGMSLMM